jgi:hypothetical protein
MKENHFNPLPDTAAEALKLWDEGKLITSAELGGMGRAYEQAIQNTAFEIIRELLKREPIQWPNYDNHVS